VPDVWPFKTALEVCEQKGIVYAQRWQTALPQVPVPNLAVSMAAYRLVTANHPQSRGHQRRCKCKCRHRKVALAGGRHDFSRTRAEEAAGQRIWQQEPFQLYNTRRHYSGDMWNDRVYGAEITHLMQVTGCYVPSGRDHSHWYWQFSCRLDVGVCRDSPLRIKISLPHCQTTAPIYRPCGVDEVFLHAAGYPASTESDNDQIGIQLFGQHNLRTTTVQQTNKSSTVQSPCDNQPRQPSATQTSFFPHKMAVSQNTRYVKQRRLVASALAAVPAAVSAAAPVIGRKFTLRGPGPRRVIVHGLHRPGIIIHGSVALESSDPSCLTRQ
jgi:hypothetical protein